MNINPSHQAPIQAGSFAVKPSAAENYIFFKFIKILLVYKFFFI